MIPWGYNLAFGGFGASMNASDTVDEPIDTPVSNGWAEERLMLAWIFENGAYTKFYYEYFAELISRNFYF